MSGKGIDHAMLVVEDLSSAKAQFERLGFMVTARADHGHTGTANHLIIFERNYIELLGIAKPGPDSEMFRLALEQREGYWLTALRTDDASAEHTHLAHVGVETDPPQTWSRALNLENPDMVSFSTLFIPPLATPEAGFFYCQHHNRQTVLSPELANHANGAVAVTGAIVVTDCLDTLTAPYQHLFGVGSIIPHDDTAVLTLGREHIRFENETSFRQRFEQIVLPEPLKGPNFAVLELAVADLDFTRACLSDKGVQYEMSKSADRVWVDPAEACGAVICLSEKSAPAQSR